MSLISNINLKDDQDFPSIQKKKSRNPKPREKWNLLWFMPTQVLNSREDVTDGKGKFVKRGKRFGFDRFNQLGCKVCRKTFHKYQSLAFHNKDQHSQLNRSSIIRSPSVTVPVKKSFSEPVRKSTRVILKPVSYDDEIEILEIDASPKRSKEIDDNKFSKLSLSAKRKIVEEYNNEPEKEIKSTKSIKKKSKMSMDKTHDDEIEVIDLEDDEPKAIKVSNESTHVPVDINKKDDEKLLVEDENIDEKGGDKKRKESRSLPTPPSDKRLKASEMEDPNDLVEVKSSSGKSMLVKKATLESILASKSLQATVASKVANGKVSQTTDVKKSPVSRRISRRIGA